MTRATPVDAPAFTPIDARVRAMIREQLDDNLFVEAGAGSGKTRALVERVVALVCERDVSIASIAAVTFTEKAAAELRDRLRDAFDAIVAGTDTAFDEAVHQQRAAAALDDLDGSAIGTLHAFAQRLLTECPIEARLPPAVEVLDEIGSQLAFDDRWSRFLDRLLDDPTVERSLLLLVTVDTNLSTLRDVAKVANSNWDLVESRGMHNAVASPPAVDVTAIIDELRAFAREVQFAKDPDDKLALKLATYDTFATMLEAAPDEYEVVRLLHADPARLGIGLNVGQMKNWRDDLTDRKERLQAAVARRKAFVARVTDAAAGEVAARIAAFTLASAEERRRAGELEFHDLLVFARKLLRDPRHGDAVRSRLRRRYTHLLLDEFQDTDPIQAEIAALLASSDPNAGALPWNEIPIDPGRLFVVGDPKQSIYRFRRADIATFLEAGTRFGRHVHLDTNFRTTPPIVAWINNTFGALIQQTPEMQPAYQPLHAARPPLAGESGPAVCLLGAVAHDDLGSASAAVLRRREADDVVAAIQTAIADRWQVADRRADAPPDATNDARLDDICILLPARTSLGHLETALDAASIPFRTETTSLVYSTRMVRDLLLALRAIDDASDELALVATLRTPLFGCGDDDLFTFKVNHHGAWNHQRPTPESLPSDHPVGEAMRYLGALHRERHWLTASVLLGRLVADRCVMELGFVETRPRDVWRRIRFLVDQARAFEDAAGGSLRDFLRWSEMQSAEGARVVESVLPETDDDAVRIMTIHGAKGLEFPIVIVSGLTTQAGGARRSPKLIFPPEGSWAVRINATIASEGYQEAIALDEQMDHHERLRLLYVACTRARDHLVVSVHRNAGAKQAREDPSHTSAELLWRACANSAESRELIAAEAIPQAVVAHVSRSAFIDFETWQRERDRALASSGAPRVFSATGIARAAASAAGANIETSIISRNPDDDGDEHRDPARDDLVVRADPGLEKEQRDIELPPWMKGRYGTAIGRAVHAVLQTVDLQTGSDIAATARAQATAEGVPQHERRIAALASAALRSESVRRAVTGPYWRETYVAVPLQDRLLEGYVDLIYRSPDGLVVVDYKTDAVGDATEIDAKLVHYRLQGAAYALAVQQAAGEPVTRCVFIFLAESGPIEREIGDLDTAMGEVAALVSSTSAG